MGFEKKLKRLEVRVSEAWLKELSAVSEELGVSKSEVVRLSVQEYLTEFAERPLRKSPGRDHVERQS